MISAAGRRGDPVEWKTRAEWCAEIRGFCSRLNAAGAEPPWTGRSLREYANAKFGVLLGLDGLGFDELRRLRNDLRLRLDALGRADGASSEAA